LNEPTGDDTFVIQPTADAAARADAMAEQDPRVALTYQALIGFEKDINSKGWKAVCGVPSLFVLSLSTPQRTDLAGTPLYAVRADVTIEEPAVLNALFDTALNAVGDDMAEAVRLTAQEIGRAAATRTPTELLQLPTGSVFRGLGLRCLAKTSSEATGELLSHGLLIMLGRDGLAWQFNRDLGGGDVQANLLLPGEVGGAMPHELGTLLNLFLEVSIPVPPRRRNGGM
jgi:hypothetical protein